MELKELIGALIGVVLALIGVALMESKENLGAVIGAALALIGAALICAALIASAMKNEAKPDFKPATAEDLAELIEATFQPKFAFGDIVKLRDYAKGFFRWPRLGDRCIVTQVLDTPYRASYEGDSRSAMRLDVALAFIDPDGDLIEFLHDSRRFCKVGTIHDPKAPFADRDAH